MAYDERAAHAAIRQLLQALDLDPEHQDLAETPERVTRAFYQDLLSGMRVDPAALLRNAGEPCEAHEASNPVILREIDVATTCPHHLMPAVGTAIVAYIPGSRLLGLGTIIRLITACSRRLTLQERIGPLVVQSLIEHAGAQGAYCRLDLWHSCVAIRGIEHPRARVTTIATAGVLDRQAELQRLNALLTSGA